MNAIEQGLLAAIAAEPDDDTHRLVFADWLDDHGDPERAEFIRAQIALARDPVDSPQRRALAWRARHLLDQHEKVWLGDLREWAVEWQWQRGFVERLAVQADTLVGDPAPLTGRPVRRLAVFGLDGNIDPLHAIPATVPLTHLDLTAGNLSFRAIERLARLKNLPGLEHLSLQFCRLGDGAVLFPTGEEFYRRLSLRLGANPFSDDGRQRLRDAFGERVSFVCRRDEGHLYRLNGEYDRFTQGTVGGYRQVFLTPRDAGTDAAYFDFEGNLLGVEHLADQAFDRGGVAEGWLRELSFQACPVLVKWFRAGPEVGINDFIYASDFDANAPDLDDLVESVQHWIADGKFALDLGGHDVWLSRDGFVTDT